MQRIVIIGNSGSGKTYLAQRLSDRLHLEIIHLDQLFWEPDGFNKKRPADMVYSEIADLAQSQSWIVEGVFGELAQEFLPKADCLIWLDIDWATCSASLLQRGSESSKQLDAQLAEENFNKLLQWASDYWQRQDLRSQRGHASLVEQFSGKKVCLKTRGEVDNFVDSLSNNGA